MHGKALQKLNEYNARGVFFDFIFSEVDDRWPEKDKYFSEKVKQSKIPVFFPYVFVNEGGKSKLPEYIKSIKVDNPAMAIDLNKYQTLPVQRFLAVPSAHFGFVNIPPDKKHVVRGLATAIRWNDGYYPFIGVVVAAYYNNVPLDEVFIKDGLLNIGKKKVKLSKYGTIKLNFGKPFKRFEHYSYADLLEGKIKDKLNNKFVIMGVNATGLGDFHVTKSSNRFPGSELHAEFLNFILKK